MTLANLPIYHISLFKMLVEIKKHIKTHSEEFFMGGKSGEKKPHLLKWSKVTKPKHMGGISNGNLKKNIGGFHCNEV